MRSRVPHDLDADSVASVPQSPVAAWNTAPLIGVLLAAAVVALAAFMNWGAILGRGARGIAGDGLITLILAVLVVIAVLVGRRRSWSAIACILLGALIAVVGIGNAYWHPLGVPSMAVQQGPGLFFTAVGGAVIAVLGLVVAARQVRVEAREHRFGQARRTMVGPTGAALIGVAGIGMGALFAWWVGTTG